MLLNIVGTVGGDLGAAGRILHWRVVAGDHRDSALRSHSLFCISR